MRDKNGENHAVNFLFDTIIVLVFLYI